MIPFQTPMHYQNMTLSQEEPSPHNSVMYFHEFDGRVINLSLAREFYIDYIPMASVYWPCVKIGISSYKLSNSFKTKKEAMDFIEELLSKMKKEGSHESRK